MSSKYRNPFKLRHSENIDSEVGFLRLFSPLALEALQEKHKAEKLWENVMLLHSSPGGGKTSLLRIFEPASLTAVINSKSAPHFKSLHTALKNIDAVSENTIKVLGVSLPCNRNYHILEELDLSEALRKRLFYSLLNSRVILATLRAACKLMGKRFPEDLSSFEFRYDNRDNYLKTINTPCNGMELFEWASGIEKSIYNTMDSFLPEPDQILEGHDELISILILKPEHLLLNGKKICSRFLFMFDDAHKLTVSQRKLLKQYIFEKRSQVNIWISERLEALNTEEQIGSIQGRDFEILNLENFWRSYPKKLSTILSNISAKRAGVSTEDVTSFQEYLHDNLNEELARDSLLKIITDTNTKLNAIAQFTNRFDDWIAFGNRDNLGLFEHATLLKEIEILVHRNQSKSQLSLEFPLSTELLLSKRNSDVKNAAVLFFSVEYGIPYYYSFSTLARLSSCNIEQFLSFSSELFEEMISNKIKGDDITLPDTIQNEIITKIANKNWKKIDAEVPYGKNVQKFLRSFGEYAKKQTFKPNAPYSPGVNGFAIRTKTHNRLYEEEYWLKDSAFEPLTNVISTCVAYNLLEKHLVNQGKKGQSWTVYYMNRWLCVLFGLPLSYGGWRHQTPDQLIKWIKK